MTDQAHGYFSKGLLVFVGALVGACAGALLPVTAQDTAVSPTVACTQHYQITVTRVVDADTLDMEVDLGLEVFTRTRVRLAGIDAWEVRGEERPQGLIASEFASRWLAESESLEIRPEDSRGFRRGKYGRWLAYVCRVGGVCLNDVLVTEGHAERSDG